MDNLQKKILSISKVISQGFQTQVHMFAASTNIVFVIIVRESPNYCEEDSKTRLDHRKKRSINMRKI